MASLCSVAPPCRPNAAASLPYRSCSFLGMNLTVGGSSSSSSQRSRNGEIGLLCLRQQQQQQALVLRRGAVSVRAAAAAGGGGGEDEATAAESKTRTPSAVKRASLSKQRRLYNRSRKSEIKTRMKKVFVALEGLQKSNADAADAAMLIKPVEVLIGEAYSVIDKAVKVGTLHTNTGRRRKSRLARAKHATEVALGWYTPSS